MRRIADEKVNFEEYTKHLGIKPKEGGEHGAVYMAHCFGDMLRLMDLGGGKP